jgi:hypothetical protein
VAALLAASGIGGRGCSFPAGCSCRLVSEQLDALSEGGRCHQAAPANADRAELVRADQARLRCGALLAALWPGGPARRTRLEAATQVIRRPIPASRLSGVGRNPSRALRVAFGDGLRPLPTEPAR